MSTRPFVGSNRIKQGGHIATHKADFNHHTSANGYRHNAQDIDVIPSITGLSATNVRTTFEEMLTLTTSNGNGFISVGSATGNQGQYNSGTASYPTFRDALLAAFSDTRLSTGGIVLILSGRYTLSNTVTVPAGITIMGELEGTVIVGQTSEQSLFLISGSSNNTTIGGDSGGGELSLSAGDPIDSVKFFNLILSDNLDGYITSGGNPIATMQTVPMINCRKNSHFICEDVKFIGRVNYGGPANRSKTLNAIGGYTSGSNSQTNLTVRRCYFDGMQIAVDFTPNNGDIDHLVVDKCRARTFGTENLASTDAEDNCFVSFTLCNATLTNNYHIGLDNGVSPTVASCFVVQASGGSTNAYIAITGNSGGPATGKNQGMLFVDANVGGAGAVSTKSIISGNNWGSNVQNEWFVVVGNSTSGTTTMPGDFNGVGAIDLVQNTTYGYPITIIVNPGTYDVTTNIGGKNYNFIGNKINGNYPIFDLAITNGSLDAGSNRFFQVGTYVKSIKFRSDIANTANYHSVHGTFLSNYGTIEFDDCLFENVMLNVPATGAAATELATIIVKNCQFLQTNDYNDNYSILLPPVDKVLIDNCVFRGAGYVGGIGNAGVDGDIFVSTARTMPIITVKNCTMDKTGYTIDNNAYCFEGTVTSDYENAYFWINGGTDSKIHIDNCYITVDNTFADTTTSIYTATKAITGLVYFSGNDIALTNTTIHGSIETVTVIGTDYSFPSVVINSTTYCSISNCNIAGGFPLQLSGTNLFSGTRPVLNIVDNRIYTKMDSGATVFTINGIDIDISNANTCYINIANNYLYSAANAGDTISTPYHVNITGASYSASGVIQIYASNSSITVTNNEIETTLEDDTNDAHAHLSGLVINDTLSTSFSNCNVANNSINIINEYSNATATDSASNMFINIGSASIKGNYFYMDNNVGVAGSNIICNLYINVTANGALNGESIVSDNVFRRKSTTSLDGGYVYIPSTSNRGFLINNTFDYTTYDGSSTALVSNNPVGPDQWLVSQNKNQTETLDIYSFMGKTSRIGDWEGGVYIPVWDGNTPVTGGGDFTLRSHGDGYNFEVNYAAAGETHFFWWYVPLYDIIPKGTIITEVTITGSSTLQYTTTRGVIYCILSGVTPTDLSDTLDFSTTSGSTGPVTVTLTPGNTNATNTFLNNDEERLFIVLRPYITADGDEGLYHADTPIVTTFTDFSVTYRW